MADSLGNAAGTGVTIKIRGKDYKILPLTIRDLAEFESYVRSKSLRAYMEASVGENSEERIKVIRMLAGSPPSSREVSAAMFTLDGGRYLVWRTLLKSDPKLTQEQVDELVNMDNLEQLTEIVQSVSGTDEENPPVPGAALPAKATDGISSTVSSATSTV